MMSIDKHITSTNFAASFNIEHSMKIVVDFLLKNRTVVADRELLTNVFASKPMIATPMSKLFEQCVQTGFVDEFATILKPHDNSISIPDMLTMNIVTDLKGFKYGAPLAPFPELKDKLVVNLSNLVRYNNLGDINISSIHELHSMFVKAMLCRSYSVSDNWLPSMLAQYVIKTYALSVASVVARNEGLNYNELLTVAAIFALYMTQRLSYAGTPLDMPPSFFNLNYLGTRADLVEFCEQAKDLSSNGLTITDCCELIARTGPSRLKKYNPAIFYRQCYSLGSYNDSISTYLAIEYPPYWVWFLIQVQSGIKLGSLANQLKTHNLLNPGKQFAQELSTTQSIFINR